MFVTILPSLCSLFFSVPWEATPLLLSPCSSHDVDGSASASRTGSCNQHQWELQISLATVIGFWVHMWPNGSKQNKSWDWSERFWDTHFPNGLELERTGALSNQTVPHRAQEWRAHTLSPKQNPEMQRNWVQGHCEIPEPAKPKAASTLDILALRVSQTPNSFFLHLLSLAWVFNDLQERDPDQHISDDDYSSTPVFFCCCSFQTFSSTLADLFSQRPRTKVRRTTYTNLHLHLGELRLTEVKWLAWSNHS